MAKILVTAGLPDGGLEELEAAGHEIVMPKEKCRGFTHEELLALIPDCEAAIACTAFDAETIHAGKQLKIIANYGAGYDSVDWREAAKCGIPVTNIPWTVTNATAELAFGLMLAVCRRIGEMDLRMRSEQPESLFGLGRYMGRTLEGQTLGIIGAGRIGGRMA